MIEVRSLHKTYNGRAVLEDVSLRIERGEMVALLGASGAGKTTLFRHLNGLQRADAGSISDVQIMGRSLQRGGDLAPDVRQQRAQIALISQQFNLVPGLPVTTNVLAGALHRLPLWRALTQRFPIQEVERGYSALARVGMLGCAWQRASTLSGGQQQRAAIARALVQEARVILADEPIASLDPESGRVVMDLLDELNRGLGVTILVSLHQVDHAFAHCRRTIALRAGKVVFDGRTVDLTEEGLREIYNSRGHESLKATAPLETREISRLGRSAQKPQVHHPR